MLLTLAFLFFVGSVLGWVLELLFRNLTQRPEKIVNPGFCTGPWLPIYGFGLCTLYLLASLERFSLLSDPILNKVMLFAAMAVGMTLIEYVAGVFCLKFLKVRLWDYSDLWGNVQGIICPLFSFFWAVLGAMYYFLVHPYILEGLNWLANNLAFSFFIGMFFGVFLMDVMHSAQLVVKLKAYAEDNDVIVRYEALKTHIRQRREKMALRYHFFRPFRSDLPLKEHLRQMQQTLEIRIRRK